LTRAVILARVGPLNFDLPVTDPSPWLDFTATQGWCKR
jgi:hypothetical protein